MNEKPANLRVKSDYSVTVGNEPIAREIDALAPVFAPDVAMWRYMAASAWQDQFRRGEIPTTPRAGIDLRHGDMFAKRMTGGLYRLLEPVSDGVNWDGRAYTIWRVMSMNAPKAAVLQETIYDVAVYQVWGG